MLNKKTIILIIISTIVASAVVLAYADRNAEELIGRDDSKGKFEEQKQEAKERPADKISTTTMAKNTDVSAEEIDTSDWQTYRNEEYGFEVKYQPYWKKATYGVENNLAQGIEKFVLLNNYKSKQKNNSIPLLNFTIFNEKFSSEIVQGEYINDITINNINFKIYKKISYSGFKYSAVVNLKDERYLLIAVSQIKNENEAWGVFEKILSTFKFIK